jgi:hypothetical protein
MKLRKYKQHKWKQIYKYRSQSTNSSRRKFPTTVNIIEKYKSSHKCANNLTQILAFAAEETEQHL